MKYYFIFKNEVDITVGYVIDDKIESIRTSKFEDDFNNIYVAKLITKIESINGYIIEIEKNQKACIEKNKLIGDIKLGDEIIVQLFKKTEDQKLDKYTMNYAIAGKNLIYYPLRQNNKFSSKINRKQIFDFKKKLEEIDIFEGITFRTSSVDEKIESIIQEYSSLIKINNYIKKQAKFLPIPRKIYSNSKYIFEFIEKEFEYIITNDNNIHNILKYYYDDKKIIYDKEYNYNYDNNISLDLASLECSKINILGDSNIVIEKTEALTVVDINSGKNKNFLSINIKAVEEALRQVELRGIQGIILIDIINIEKKELEILIRKTKEFTYKYPKISYLGISNVGLMEFIRTGIKVDI